MSHSVAALEIFTKTYRDNESRGAAPTNEQMDAEAERLQKTIAALGTAGAQRRIYTAADYIDECLNFDPSRDFTPALFGGLAFPDGTTSYIGARTSRGKTTAMVNLAREAMSGKAPRKVVFITLEMSGKQIMNKLILSTAYSMATAAGETTRAALDTITAGKEIYQVWKKDGAITGTREAATAFRRYVSEAYKRIEARQREGGFILYDGRGATEAEIVNYMTTEGERGAIVLLDYIQKMPPKAGTDTDSFRRVQAISYDVVNSAAASNAVIIAGAQFNRIGGADALGDVFTDESFRECGDLEQDAHNAIGLGWAPDKKDRFYEVLKTREDNKQGEIYTLDFAGAYSYMAHGHETHRDSRPAKAPAKKGRGAAKKTTTVYNDDGSTEEVEFTGGEIL
ncbi:MAG: Replicative DNA helicase [Treponematales bacterium]